MVVPVAEPTEPSPPASAGGRVEGLAGRLPSWMGSIRWRMAVVTSVVLFGLATVVVAGVYVVQARSLADQPVTRQVVSQGRWPDGTPVVVQSEVLDLSLLVEKEANTRALEQLRNTSVLALGLLYVGSVGIGWVVAGQLLRPIHRITAVAREIGATDLTRRIALEGPRDELTELADTFDDMLGRLDEAFESQRAFIHEASHELRNPLASIRTTVEVALAQDDPEADRRALEVVERSSVRIAALVDDLLVHARQGRIQRSPSAFDLGVLAREVTDELAASAEAGGVRLEVEETGATDEASDPTRSSLEVTGDREGLAQALANLVLNALRFAPAGSRILVATGSSGPRAWVSVSDEGPGIAVEDQERIFQRFVRLEPDRSPDARLDASHSGLGLTIVRQVAEAHGGGVEVASVPGQGATFTIWLPLR